VQGLGKTITTIALLVSNQFEPTRAWERVKVDLHHERPKRLKWSELQKMESSGEDTTPEKAANDEPQCRLDSVDACAKMLVASGRTDVARVGSSARTMPASSNFWVQ
jgi:hypothetical protein